ncbi:TKL protein kinase [Phytophthora nicotianae INRA-310]|uniref:TKL protein kinase n=1 Tax=Phytophthora nicotianae (strain INRA-310) TaxID=761204 RepID=W2Q1W2_PHYN3|nr:TKL protein kinase [Phytophthora nicotianae INRA-310]ETN07178.1 TKL protein kinase [Phytophthora nicotianae INRA-310]
MRINRWRRSNHLPNAIRTPDRLGDYLVALRNDFVTANSSCRRGLNLSGELSAYEKETRVLLKLASTGRVVDILLRFGRVVESYMEVLSIEMTEEIRQWRGQLDLERRERVELFRDILNDEQRLIEAMGDETQQMELLTLLKYGLTHYEKFLIPEELDVISDVYDRVVSYSDFMLVGDPPSWFLSPSDLVCDQGGIYYLDAVRVSKCETGDILRDRGGDHQSWEDEEEACLRQATVWADLNHPHVAKMLGACHIGKEPFVVHEPAEPLISNRANAQSWEPLLGWALGLQYLHERELGYKNFDDNRLLARHHVTASGVLSGLGLVPVKRRVSASLQRGVSNMFNMRDLAATLPQNHDDAHVHGLHVPTWSVPNDIFAFGLAIYNTRRWVSMYSDEEAQVLPPERPQFLNAHEWDLVERMCARNPQMRASMWYVVHQLRSLVKEAEQEDLSEASAQATYIPPEDIDDFIVPTMNEKVAKAMPRLERKCQEIQGSSEAMLQHVVDRLSGVYAQLQTRENVRDAITVMEGFVGVLDLFYEMLTRRDLGKEQSSTSVVASFCASRAAAQNVAIFHHEIDRLLTLTELGNASSSAPTHPTLADIREDSTDSIDMTPDTQDIHDWQIKWNKLRREQLRAFQACLKSTEELLQQLSDPKDRLEAQMLLQFELHKRRSSYPNSVLDAMTQALKVLGTVGGGAERVPSWFIPPYEVVLGKFIAQGGFGAVYYGKWFDTDVVVKILKPQTPVKSTGKNPSPPTSNSGTSEEDTMALFRREADHWFMLNHQNVVHLYGACHVGTPFFVCEPAKSISLNSHVESLARARPGYNFEERGADPSDIMRCLLLAGIGLKYLHERGIVHCDLKGNNFMVGTDGKTIKLGDFGMSVLKRSGKGRHTAHANVGAVPWKAPEYLKGEDPTVMSDVYGFGMCILELFSGKFPWAGTLEVAVKFHVTKRKILPPRPKKLTNFQWSLIEHMCCYEANKRISLDAVVDMLHTFRFWK